MIIYLNKRSKIYYIKKKVPFSEGTTITLFQLLLDPFLVFLPNVQSLPC